MGISFKDFKEFANRREFNDFRSYLEIVKIVEEFYHEEQIKFFYPRNIFNSKEKELIFFIEEGYFTVKMIDDKYVIEHKNCILVNKTINTSRYHNHEQFVRLEFNNGDFIDFNSIKDSNENWEHDYSTTIRNLYKTIV